MSSPRLQCRVAPCVILVVEDESLVRYVTSRTLMDGGYHVLEAENGLDALEMLRGGAAVDLVLTDVKMPHMDGAVLARIVAHEFPGLPLILVSGYAEIPIDGGSHRFVQKPFRAEVLLGLIADLIEAPQGR